MLNIEASQWLAKQQLIETKAVVHLLRVPFSFLAPGIVLLAVIGAYAVRGLVLDAGVLVVAGVAGYFLRRTGYSMAGLVLGLVLGKIGEKNCAQAMQVSYDNWSNLLSRPSVAGLVALGRAIHVPNRKPKAKATA